MPTPLEPSPLPPASAPNPSELWTGTRRQALHGLGLAGAAILFATSALAEAGDVKQRTAAAARLNPNDWESVRAQFPIDRSYIHMSGLLFASHPTPVRQAIDDWRAHFDANPTATIHGAMPAAEEAVRSSLASYLGVKANELALTDSTTMGLGLLYAGMRLSPGDEVVTSEHDHFSTHEALRLACERSGATLVKVRLYERGREFAVAPAAAALKAALGPKTRVVALTWVHSATGVRLPIPALADVIEQANKGRAAAQRIVFGVDGVHGTGACDLQLASMGCDFFAAGTHKWLFGPRGTGFLWGREAAQERVRPTFPSFSTFHQEANWARLMTPGGFHTYEHRWAVPAAVNFHQTIGKGRIQARIQAFASQLKDGLAGVKGLTMHTPAAPDYSAGIVCFELPGMTPAEVVAALDKRRIIASTTPYAVSYARLTPGLLNSEADVAQTIKAVTEIGLRRS